MTREEALQLTLHSEVSTPEVYNRFGTLEWRYEIGENTIQLFWPKDAKGNDLDVEVVVDGKLLRSLDEIAEEFIVMQKAMKSLNDKR